MIYIQDASPLENYRVKVSFTSGEEGIADMSDIINRGVFKKLKDKKQFKNFLVDKNQQTITWDNGQLDIAPEAVYFRAFKDKPELQNLFKKWGYLDRYA